MIRDWRPLDLTRVAYEHPAGFTVVKPAAAPNSVPLFCGVCDFPLLSTEDGVTAREHGCCAACCLKWVDLHRNEWGRGWRPTPEMVTQEVARRRQRVPRFQFGSDHG